MTTNTNLASECVLAELSTHGGVRSEAVAAADAFTALRAGFDVIHDAVLIYSKLGVLLYANRSALRELRMDDLEQHPQFRAGLIIYDAGGHRLEQSDWPLFRALRGETVVGAELTIKMPNMPVDQQVRQARIDATPTTFGDILREPVVVVIVKDITEQKVGERLLQQSVEKAQQEQSFLEAVLDSLHVAVVIADPCGRFTRANWAYRHLFGTDLHPVDLDQYDAFEGYDPRDGRRLSTEEWPLVHALRDGATTVGKPIDIRRPDNHQLRNMLISAAPICDDSGGITGGVVVAEDITDLRRAEQDARSSEERLRLMIDGAHDHAFCMLDRNGRIGTWSAGGERLKQYPASEAIGQPYSILFSSDDIVAGLPGKLLEEAEKTGVARYRGWRYRRDGSRFWVDTVISAVYDIKDLVGFAEVARDMTALRNSEEQLRLRDEALRAVSQGILVADIRTEDQPIVLVSGGFSQLTGYSPAEVLGRNCRFLQGTQTDYRAIMAIREAIAAEREISIELENLRKDGSSFWNALFLSPIRDEGGRVDKYVGVMADVTERRSLEEKLRHSQKMDALGRMAGGIAHDFNNILMIINGNAEELIEEFGANHPAREQLDMILDAGTRAELLTNQLLAFNRQSSVEMKSVSLPRVVDQMRSLLSCLVGDAISLAIDIAPDCWNVLADRSQMEQVLLNVVVNARDAMPEGGKITIRIANEAATTPGTTDMVALTIADTGLGMDQRTVARAFEPFFTTKGNNGSGLGLATVFGVVSQSNGTAALRSSPGKGTTVEIRLPRGGHDVETEPPQPPIEVPLSHIRTVLIAEDEADVRRLIRRHLERRGMQVLEARNGLEALSIARRHSQPLDLLVTDVMMPAMNGVALAEALRLRQPTLPVLFVTGFADGGLTERLANETVVKKPLSARSLGAVIQKMFG